MFERLKGMMEEDVDSVEQMLLEEMKDIYDAEHQLLDAIPDLIRVVNSKELKAAIRHHRFETEYQIRRLEQAFAMLDEEPERETCEAMNGLVKELQEMMGRGGSPMIKDLGLIANARRIEHYEMAAYENLIVLAYALGHEDLAHLFEETLAEEITADDLLSTHSEALVGLKLLHLEPRRSETEA